MVEVGNNTFENKQLVRVTMVAVGRFQSSKCSRSGVFKFMKH